jgi:hypothetical protein
LIPELMPLQARIAAPGALHHIVILGIEQTRIFVAEKDREDFISRISVLLQETQTRCYAWALMGSHAHLLLRSGYVPITSVMRRIPTGYAAGFNRIHCRHGRLLQNRYNSILCEEVKPDLRIQSGSEAASICDKSTMKQRPHVTHVEKINKEVSHKEVSL